MVDLDSTAAGNLARSSDISDRGVSEMSEILVADEMCSAQFPMKTGRKGYGTGKPWRRDAY